MLVLLGMAFAAVATLACLKIWEHFRDSGRNPPSADQAKLQSELIRVIDEGKRVEEDAFPAVSSRARMIWEEKTVAFVDAVFGPQERQRFESNRGSIPSSEAESLRIRINNLEELRDGSARRTPQASGTDLDAAIKERRTYGYGEVVLAAGSPAEHFAGMAEAVKRLAPSFPPYATIGANLHLFHPVENVDLLIGELQITNRQADRNLSIEVEFEVPIEGKGHPWMMKTLPPSFTASVGLNHPVLTDAPILIPPERSHRGDFAVFIHNRDVDMLNVVAIVRDLISGHEQRVEFFADAAK